MREEKMTRSGFSYIESFPELNHSIDLTNSYIQSDQNWRRFLSVESDADKVTSAIPMLHIERFGSSSFAYFEANEHKNSQIVLNEEFLQRFRVLKNTKINSLDEEEWVLLVFFWAIVLVHEFCHFVVRFKKPERKTPIKLRRKHRGRMMDAGHSLEIVLFNGILGLVGDSKVHIQDGSKRKFRKIIIQMNNSSKTYEADVNLLKTIVSNIIPSTDLFENNHAVEYIPEKDDEVYESPISEVEYNVEIDDDPSSWETDEQILTRLGLDPQSCVIMWLNANCYDDPDHSLKWE
jgi:hypothetical protein